MRRARPHNRGSRGEFVVNSWRVDNLATRCQSANMKKIRCASPDACARVLQPGDHIARPALVPALVHHGIVDAQLAVVHAQPGRGVVREPLDVFQAGRPIEVIRRAQEPAAVVARAEAMLGRPFALLSFNCEHLARYASEGRAESHQLADWLQGI